MTTSNSASLAAASRAAHRSARSASAEPSTPTTMARRRDEVNASLGTITTGFEHRWLTVWLTEPSTISANRLRPRVPTTTNSTSGSSAACRITSDADPLSATSCTSTEDASDQPSRARPKAFCPMNSRAFFVCGGYPGASFGSAKTARMATCLATASVSAHPSAAWLPGDPSTPTTILPFLGSSSIAFSSHPELETIVFWPPRRR